MEHYEYLVNLSSQEWQDIIVDGNTDTLTIKLNIVDEETPVSEIKMCFPGREFVLSDEVREFDCEYGYFFPAPYITFVGRSRGVTVILADTLRKHIRVKKTRYEMSVYFEYAGIKTKDRPELLFTVHSSDWHDGIDIYKNWYNSKYGAHKKMAAAFRGKFHMRRYFFNKELCEKNICHNGKIDLIGSYREDCDAVGGIDAGLLFDFAYTNTDGIRCGNNQPFKGFKEIDELNRQIEFIRRKFGTIFFAYFDPYLIQDGSDFDKEYRGILPVLNSDGTFCRIWDFKQWTPCLSAPEWKRECLNYLHKISESLKITGFYLDEMGNGNQFICYSDRHGHEIPSNQIREEAEFVKFLKKHLKGQSFMCEFFPADNNVENYAAMLSDSKSVIEITRFLYPHKKIFRTINTDRPVGDDFFEINKVFFNGIGLWLDNDLNNTCWYSERVKRLIKKHYKILRKYSRIFESEKVRPLIYDDGKGILLNSFHLSNEAIVTYINISDVPRTVPILEFINRTKLFDLFNVELYDIYNGEPINIHGDTDIASIKIRLGSKCVGALYLKDM